jgi:hypothetical protein
VAIHLKNASPMRKPFLLSIFISALIFIAADRQFLPGVDLIPERAEIGNQIISLGIITGSISILCLIVGASLTITWKEFNKL